MLSKQAKVEVLEIIENVAGKSMSTLYCTMFLYMCVGFLVHTADRIRWFFDSRMASLTMICFVGFGLVLLILYGWASLSKLNLQYPRPTDRVR